MIYGSSSYVGADCVKYLSYFASERANGYHNSLPLSLDALLEEHQLYACIFFKKHFSYLMLLFFDGRSYHFKDENTSQSVL